MPFLTDEQLAVATAPENDRLLVTAGPGTGKTHTLVERLVHLVEVRAVHPGSILVLSFSRAAVGELRRRLRASDTEAAGIIPVTFDSVATRLLANIDEDGQWTEQSYDGRIAHAIDKIGEIGEFLESIDHVCVDELQDLVSVRMRFVQALLKTLNGGFTLLGDPAQGIYDFSLAEGETATEHGSPAFYQWLRDRYSSDLIEHRLTFNHRAKSDAAKSACDLGPLVESDPATAGTKLFEILEDSTLLPGVSFLEKTSGTRTAVLCRKNGQALWVSRALADAGVEHNIQRGAASQVVAPWLARVCMANEGGIVSRSKLERLLDAQRDTAEWPIPTISDIWRPLRQVGSANNTVDLDRVVKRLRTGGIPEDLHDSPSSTLTVSTVHRAKGLEFDKVVVVPDGWDEPFEDDDAKTLFVAISRTINDLFQLKRPDLVGRLQKHQWSDRWTYVSWNNWPKAMGIERGDLDSLEPPKGDRGYEETQQLLWEAVRPGDPVEMRFKRIRIGEPGAIYDLVWNDIVLATASESFGRDLLSVLKGGGKNWKYPKRIIGLRIDGMRTVGGDPMVTNQAGLGTSGTWLLPSLVGLGEFEYEWENS